MKKSTILLIQDARTQGNSAKRYLEHAGHTVIWAGSGISALLAAGKHEMDLILLDVSLPDIDGSDLCQRLRSRRDTHTIPIILFTAHEPAAGTFRRRPDGPDDYLAKPFTADQLGAKISAVLAARAAAQEAKLRQQEEQRKQEERERLQDQQRPAPEQPPARPEGTIETFRSGTTPGPRSALKPKPEAAITPPAPKPTLRLVPKPQHAAAAQAGSSPTGAETSNAPPKPSPIPQAPAAPPFTGSPDEVVDPSTGLFSRTQFEAMFSKEFKRAVRFKQQMSCMLIDLDGSAMGRKADEDLVKALIGVVQGTIREVDTAAWWTGGALIVLLPNTIRNDAVQAAMRILEAVAAHPFTWPDATQVMVSIGVAGLPDRQIDSEQRLLDAAAAACKRARETMQRPEGGGKP